MSEAVAPLAQIDADDLDAIAAAAQARRTVLRNGLLGVVDAARPATLLAMFNSHEKGSEPDALALPAGVWKGASVLGVAAGVAALMASTRKWRTKETQTPVAPSRKASASTDLHRLKAFAMGAGAMLAGYLTASAAPRSGFEQKLLKRSDGDLGEAVRGWLQTQKIDVLRLALSLSGASRMLALGLLAAFAVARNWPASKAEDAAGSN